MQNLVTNLDRTIDELRNALMLGKKAEVSWCSCLIMHAARDGMAITLEPIVAEAVFATLLEMSEKREKATG